MLRSLWSAYLQAVYNRIVMLVVVSCVVILFSCIELIVLRSSSLFPQSYAGLHRTQRVQTALASGLAQRRQPSFRCASYGRQRRRSTRWRSAGAALRGRSRMPRLRSPAGGGIAGDQVRAILGPNRFAAGLSSLRMCTRLPSTSGYSISECACDPSAHYRIAH